MAGLGFSRGLPGAWWMLSGTAGLMALSILLAEMIRATGYSTLPEIAVSFYGEGFRTVAVSWVGVIAVQIVAVGKIAGIIFGGSEALFMVIFTAVFILYTFIGDQVSVVRTDLIQFIIILIGIAFHFIRTEGVMGLA